VVVAYDVTLTCRLHAWMSGGCDVCEARMETSAGVHTTPQERQHGMESTSECHVQVNIN
jgi:hypothetical protein